VAETEDLGPRGCQLLSLRPLEVGGAARLVIETDRVVTPLSVLGRVAWSNGIGRHRAGVAFAERQPGVDPAGWFRKLLLTQPGLEAGMSRVPERLAVDAKLFLRPPPEHIFDFSPDEVAVLKLLGDGTTVGDVVERGPLSEGRAARSVFALLERRVLTLALGEAAPAWRWRAVLADLDARPLAPVIGLPPRPREHPTPRPWVPPRLETVVAAVAPRPSPAAAYAARGGTQPGVPAPTAGPARDRAGAAGGRARSPEAQACFDRAVSAVSAGEISGAIALLRRALALSPRDPEIAALLTQLAYRDRPPPRR
jgi:hypothetical protein